MFLSWNTWFLPSGLGTIRTLVFLLLTPGCEGRSQMLSPSQPILAMLGDDIMLPCHLEPARDVSMETLEWARLDLDPRFVHLRRDGVNLLASQNPWFSGRTSLLINKLTCGDVSLKVSDVRVSDEGEYRCYIPDVASSTVQLIVGAASSPVVILSDMDRPSGSVELQCESAGWYPEPEVLWLDGEGNLLPAGPTETLRGPDDLYTVSSRVTVDQRHSNIITCRVQQNNINQTRSTEIHILDEVFSAPSGSSGQINIVVVVVVVVLSSFVFILLLSAVLFVLWKWRLNKTNKTTEEETGERENLMTESLELKDLDKEQLKKKEEKKDLEHVIELLMELKEKLEMSRGKQIKHVEEVKTEIREKEKKLETIEKAWIWKVDPKPAQFEKQELEKKKTKCEESLEKTEEKLEKTEKMIERMEKQLEDEETEKQREEEEVNKTTDP